jgi:cell division cycle 20-like protein 1 (cofactor of APC complex)
MVAGEMEVPIASTERIAEEIQTPTLISPPESKTPPTATHRRNQTIDFSFAGSDKNSAPVDANQLSKALELFEQAGKVRERTPTASPSRKRQRVYGDRCVVMATANV